MSDIPPETIAASLRASVVKDGGKLVARTREVFKVFGIESPTQGHAQLVHDHLAAVGLVATPMLDPSQPKARVTVRLADAGAAVKVGQLPGQAGNASGTLAWLDGCVYQGGHGYQLEVGRVYGLAFEKDGLKIPLSPLDPIPYADIRGIEIGGPGAVTTGGRFIGGGFGAQGFIEGAALAHVLNSSTAKQEIHTFVGVQTRGGEAIFHYQRATPQQTKIALSAVFGRLREIHEATPPSDATGLEDPVMRLAKLSEMMTQGLITAEEFGALKADVMRRVQT